MVDLEIFSKVVLKKLKLHNLIKRKIRILTKKKKKSMKIHKVFQFLSTSFHIFEIVAGYFLSMLQVTFLLMYTIKQPFIH